MSGYRNFAFRMPAGFAGDVTRMTPAAVIEPCAADPTSPPDRLGIVVVVDAASSGVRPIAAVTEQPYGVVVRAYPMQNQTASGYYGAASFGQQIPMLQAGQPLTTLDVLRQGYIMMPVNGSPKKGAAIHVWVAATSAPHVRGGLEATGSAGNTITLGPEATFNGTPDANGLVEVAWGVGVTVASTAALAAAADEPGPDARSPHDPHTPVARHPGGSPAAQRRPAA